MVKVCIWLGPAVVCLQIYCWSPAIYVPNWRQNLKKASTRRQGPKNYRQFWAEQFSARKRTAAGKIELGGADLLSFCLQQPSWKSLNDDEELQEEKLATMSQLFQNNHNQPHSYYFGKASFTMPLTNSCCTKGTPVWLGPGNGLNRTPNPYTASLHRTWNVNARTDLWALSINLAKQIYLLLVSLTS